MAGTPTRRTAARRRLIDELKAERQKIKFTKKPFRTSYLVGRVVWRATKKLGERVITSRKRVLYPLLLVSLFCFWVKDTRGPHAAFVDECEVWIEWALWWLALGVASSIGFGSGMHTGLLFLFPHILKVCQTVERCGHADFDSRRNMWFQMAADELFACTVNPRVSASYLDIWFNVLPSCVVWGSGTSFGEIPPYWVSFLAAKAGKENKELSDITHVDVKDMDGIQRRVHEFKLWMISFMKKYGFFGLLAMASWPNAAFDLCGVCCGSFMMPFWIFITATTLGKGFVKAPVQGLVLSALFYKNSREQIIAFVSGWLPMSWEVDKTMNASINSMLQKVVSSSKLKEAATSAMSPSRLWGYLVTSLVAYFLLSCVEAIARLEQARLDMERVNADYPGREHLD